jgi:hypothetical protein
MNVQSPTEDKIDDTKDRFYEGSMKVAQNY